MNHWTKGWPEAPFSVPPGDGGYNETAWRYHGQVYSPGNVIWVYDAGGWSPGVGSNAVDNILTSFFFLDYGHPYFIQEISRHAIDLPNMLFCDGHAVPFEHESVPISLHRIVCTCLPRSQKKR